MLKTRPTRGLLSHQAGFKYHTCNFHLFFSLCDHGLIMWYMLAVSWSTKQKKKRKCLFRFTCQKNNLYLHSGPLLVFYTGQSWQRAQLCNKKMLYGQKKEDFYVTQLIKPLVFLLSWVKSTRSHMHTYTSTSLAAKIHAEDKTGSPVFMFSHELEFIFTATLSYLLFISWYSPRKPF